VSSTMLFRLGGLSLLLGGLLSILYLFIHPEGSGLAYYEDPMTAPSHLVGFVAVLMVLLGLPGLYARQAQRAGILGLAGMLLVFFGLAILDGTHNIIDSTVTPALATVPDAGPLLAERGSLEEAIQSGMLGTLVGAGGPMLLLGLILLGIATIRANVLPRWTGALLIIAAPITPLGFLVPSLEDLTLTVPYLALGCLGFILLAGEGSLPRRAAESEPRVQ
jgi:hypothetical protein